MRRGYWRTLTRQLRDKVAIGENVFICADQTIAIVSIEADADADLGTSHEVLLARDDRGNALILDTTSSTVLMKQADGVIRILADDLRAFVDGLHAPSSSTEIDQPIQTGLTLGDVMDEPLDFPKPRRGMLDD